MSQAAKIYSANVREIRRHFYELEDRLYRLYRPWLQDKVSWVQFDQRRLAIRAEMDRRIEQERAAYRQNAAEERSAFLRDLSEETDRRLLGRGVADAGYSVWDNGAHRVLTRDEVSRR
jgi:hypothetical protein